MNYHRLMRAAVARRLFNLSRSIEATARACRGLLEPEDLAELWRQARTLFETAHHLHPQKDPEIPDTLVDNG